MSFGSCLGGAVAAADFRRHPSVARLFAAVVLGLALAPVSGWFHWRTGSYFARRLADDNAKLRWVYLGAAVWLIVAAILTQHIISLALGVAT